MRDMCVITIDLLQTNWNRGPTFILRREDNLKLKSVVTVEVCIENVFGIPAVFITSTWFL